VVFNNLPLKHLKQAYHFEPTSEWIEHLRSSAVRSTRWLGLFRLGRRLVMTNHHVGRTCFKIQPNRKDYHKDGFLAKTPCEESRHPTRAQTCSLHQDVTDRILAGVTGNE